MPESETPARALTIEEAVSVAILLQRNEQLAAAHELYRRVLEVVPDHPRALHYAGVLAQQEGRKEDALALIEKSLALAPDQADSYNNLGIVLQSLGRLEAAANAYQRAIVIDPSHANAYSNLGVILRATGRSSEAEAAYRKAIDLNPQHIDAHTNLGILLNGLRRTEEAVACFCKAITLRPKHRDTRKLLALAHCTLGEVDKAVSIFQEWLEDDAADPIPLHMLAACTGREVPPRASNAFVQQTFDSFAASFESKLERLSYRAPTLVAAMLADAGVEQAEALDILDAGCGTGLCGPLLLPYARRLTGVDLSEQMLTRAREKHVYDELVQAELTEYLAKHPAAFDVIVSADTLVYFGDLRETFAAAAAALRSGGYLIFTLEQLAGVAPNGYRLEMHGRYSHDRTHIEQLLAEHGLQPVIAQAELRLEAGVPVAGLVVRAITPILAHPEARSVSSER
jgi:predicted TPR repeat methyltransferase